MSYIKSANRNQACLYTSLDDQIGESNPVRIIDVLIDKILADNSDLITESKDTGRPRYHDGAMLKIMLYSYLHRIRSSRRIERECSINLELRWLVCELVPDHWTIAHYRIEQEAKIKSVTKLFRKFIKEQGYITGDLVVHLKNKWQKLRHRTGGF